MLNLTKAEKESLDTFTSTVRKVMGENLISIFFFGSRSAGHGDENSDLDVLVLLKSSNMKMKHMIWDVANDILLDSWINISPMVMTYDDFERLISLQREFALHIKKNGVSL